MKKLSMILPLALIVCFMVGCQNKAAMAELEAMKAQEEIEEQNKEVVKHYFEELNKGNLESWNELCAPDFAYYEPSGVPEPSSLEETIELYEMAFQSFPDLNWSIHDLIAKGDKIIARFTVTGTHSGDWAGIPATGKKTKNTAIVIFHMRDGKCIETRAEGDTLGFMIQLGMELKPKEVEK